MNAWLGWGLAAVAMGVATLQYGWAGSVMAATVIVFWLLLQMSRALRVMRAASRAPVGQVASAVMLHSRLKHGLRLIDILTLTRSLGARVALEAGPGADGDGADEAWEWRDAAGDAVQVWLRAGRCVRWTLRRAESAPLDAP